MADTNPAALGTPGRAYSPRNRVPKAGPAIRQALGPPLRERFEVELRAALEAAEHDFDLDRALQVIERWWPRALLSANPESRPMSTPTAVALRPAITACSPATPAARRAEPPPMRYTVRWASYAARQRDDLPRPAHEQLLVALDLLATDPRAGYYDDTNDQWSVTFGELGIILYTIEDRWRTIAVLRVMWIGD